MMRQLLPRCVPAFASLALAGVGSAALPPCDPVPGVERLLRPGAVVLVGEIHGTREGPAAVARLACLALAHDLSVTVGLEIPETDQPVVDRFLDSEGNAGDQAELIGTHFWQKDYQDGRSSLAMLEIIETLHEYRIEGAEVQIVFFDRRERQRTRDQSMARALASAHQAEPSRFMVALTGNLHSELTGRGESGPMGYELGRLLPDSEIVSLRLTHAGGTAWICTPEDCGTVQLRGREAPVAIELRTGLAPDRWVGTYHLGEITASPPARLESPD